MARVIFFSDIHVRTSQDSRAARLANNSNVTHGLPRSAAKHTTAVHRGAGIPLERQPLTVELSCDKASATTPVPPQVSMMSSQEKSMDGKIVRNMRTCQEFATRETTFSSNRVAIVPVMDTNDKISARLLALRNHVGMDQQSFAKAIGVEKNTYNPFERGKRTLSFEAACLIRRRFGVSIDWLFFGDMRQVAGEIEMKIGPDPIIFVSRKTQNA